MSPAGGTRPAAVSQSAQRLTTYANDVDPLARVFDGSFVHSRIGIGAPLHDDIDPDWSPVQFRADRRSP